MDQMTAAGKSNNSSSVTRHLLPQHLIHTNIYSPIILYLHVFLYL